MVARNQRRTRTKSSGQTPMVQSAIKARKGTRFPGINADARILGVHRVTLYRALTGKWKLPGLVARYWKMKGGAN